MAVFCIFFVFIMIEVTKDSEEVQATLWAPESCWMYEVSWSYIVICGTDHTRRNKD